MKVRRVLCIEWFSWNFRRGKLEGNIIQNLANRQALESYNFLCSSGSGINAPRVLSARGKDYFLIALMP